MSGSTLAEAGENGASLVGRNVTFVIIAAVIALIALGFAAGLVKAVLATDKGTQKMQEIAGAVQEGASAYLNRQFKALSVLVVVAVGLLWLLPAESTEIKFGRSAFFIVGALFSGFIGWAGMSLATRANVRVAAAARVADGGREQAMQIAFRTGGVVGFMTIGLGLFGAAVVVLLYKGDAPTVLEGFGFGAALL
ncbi:MAG: sodium/proton-translocating pyrophosphatase, partial [Longispora sp.]|nr:sodium/proton-translocating pyrophosphatase [Longispora sp. (in: high G+C Gram-positive bacteria)]